MKLNKSYWLSNGCVIFSTLFFVFCFIGIENSISSIRVTKLGIVSIAPENLNRSLESFRLSLIVESRDFPAEEMVKTKSWGKLKSTVSAYAQRLELIENQNRRRSITVSCLYLFSAIGMATFAILNRKKQRKFEDVQPNTGI
jgi:hypothetical protein